MSQSRRYTELFLVALAASIITAALPAMAHGVKHALFAHDADKIDGKDSASATSTASKRRSKLATYAESGFLPNNALKKASNADKLDGKDSASFATHAELTGAVLAFNLASCPTGWAELEAARGRYVVGLNDGGTLGGLGGDALDDLEDRAVGQHGHSLSTHTHEGSDDWGYDETTPEGSVRRPLFGFRPDDANSPDVPVVDSANATVGIAGSVAGTNAPYIQLLICEKN